MFESSKFDKSGLKSGSHIRPGPDLKKNGRIPARAGAGYDIWCNPNKHLMLQYLLPIWLGQCMFSVSLEALLVHVP